MWLTSLRRYKQSCRFFVPVTSDVRGERTGAITLHTRRARGHERQLGRVIVSWMPCDCPAATARGASGAEQNVLTQAISNDRL
jgi:hypothetical protein